MLARVFHESYLDLRIALFKFDAIPSAPCRPLFVPHHPSPLYPEKHHLQPLGMVGLLWLVRSHVVRAILVVLEVVTSTSSTGLALNRRAVLA